LVALLTETPYKIKHKIAAIQSNTENG